MKPPTRRQVNEARFKKLRKKQAEISGRKPGRNPKYLAFVRTQPCLCCCKLLYSLKFGIGRGISAASEAAHTGTRGLGQKAADTQAVPLCAQHHRIGKDSHHVLGKKFFEHHGLNLEAIQGELHRRFAEEAD